MQNIYIAHRLFAFHDRMLASEVAHILSQHDDVNIFLPYCDTREEAIQIEKKGRYLFEADIARLKDLGVMVAIVHGPSYDDGVCMEIGFAFAQGTPLVILTTDFITYSFGAGKESFIFSDPLLSVINATCIRVFDPIPESQDDAIPRYEVFHRRNGQSLRHAINNACAACASKIDDSVQKATSSSEPIVYIEPSPYCSIDHYQFIADKVRQCGWNVHIAQRLKLNEEYSRVAALEDLHMALKSRILVLDANGPETPAGTAFLLGVGLATGKQTLLHYGGSQTTHANGREPNLRNLMILYGCSILVREYSELEQALIPMLS